MTTTDFGLLTSIASRPDFDAFRKRIGKHPRRPVSIHDDWAQHRVWTDRRYELPSGLLYGMLYTD